MTCALLALAPVAVYNTKPGGVGRNDALVGAAIEAFEKKVMVSLYTDPQGDLLTATPLPRVFYDRPTLAVARDLPGKLLLRRTADGVAGGVIVETEAYVAAIDPASHGFRGQTPRNRSMFGAPGRAYVYRSYGIHFCLNVVTEGEGAAAAVLIRAIRPLVGLALMRERRGERISDRDLARGPGRLCQALALTTDDDGADLCGPALWIAEPPESASTLRIATTPRVGISQAADWLWRFVVVNEPYVSARGVRTPRASK